LVINHLYLPLNVLKASDYFTLPSSLSGFADFFKAEVQPWVWISQIQKALASFNFKDKPVVPAGVHIEGDVYIHPSVKLPPYCVITGPVWIGPDCVIRPGALIRGNVIAGARCVLGNSSEYKNCLLLEDVETAHYNYVGDSVLGNGAHLGAGAICSNLRLDRKTIHIVTAQETFDTKLTKCGAILGDKAEVGCNAVLNPGTVLGKRSLVMPTIAFSGVLAPATIARISGKVTTLPRRD
jgi:UDP-N-acetylglucosamine diphosphorylase / glucose-1-phosphate thymidylyltransferase / UDP-N-acetylgalactosamine diphosphorylase / glucosamine-1-phosphate N-acetyltransferase / galactosamine-1-phosphate N-acetyltransferase